MDSPTLPPLPERIEPEHLALIIKLHDSNERTLLATGFWPCLWISDLKELDEVVSDVPNDPGYHHLIRLLMKPGELSESVRSCSCLFLSHVIFKS